MSYETKDPLTFCPKKCSYRKESVRNDFSFRVKMHCHRYRHPLYRAKEVGKKIGRNIQPAWCIYEGEK